MSSGLNRTSDVLEGLLSVDFAAQLRKTLSHSHAFPQQYVVELVRWCVAQGATRLQFSLSSRELTLKWEGGEAPCRDLESLSLLMGPDHAWEVREAALESFHAIPGLGLLAVWACLPSLVLMHLQTADGPISLEYAPGRFVLQPRPRVAADSTGVRSIRIERKSDYKAEVEALREYCRFAPATITVNGAEITVGTLPPEGLVGFGLRGDEGHGFGLLWVPRKGDLCRLVLLRHGVRWKMVATATHRKGLVYEGAVQTEGVTSSLMHTLDGAAKKLYARLAQSVDGMTDPERARVEHLLLNYARISGDTRLLEQANLFPKADGSCRVSLEQLREWVSHGSVAAVSKGYSKGSKSPAVAVNLVRLSDNQASFLREMGVDIPLFQPRSLRRDGSGLRKARDWATAVLGRLSQGGLIPSDRQTAAQRLVVQQLEEVLASGLFVPWGVDGGTGCELQLRTGRGRCMVQHEREGETRQMLVLRAGNARFVRAAFWAAAGAPARLWVPWLLEGRGVWTSKAESDDVAAKMPPEEADSPTRPLI